MFDETHFNFTAQLEPVYRCSVQSAPVLDVGGKYHHISNANLGNVNDAMDSLTLFVGVSFFR